MLINKTYTKASKKIYRHLSYYRYENLIYAKIITVLLYFKHLRVKMYKSA